MFTPSLVGIARGKSTWYLNCKLLPLKSQRPDGNIQAWKQTELEFLRPSKAQPQTHPFRKDWHTNNYPETVDMNFWNDVLTKKLDQGEPHEQQANITFYIYLRRLASHSGMEATTSRLSWLSFHLASGKLQEIVEYIYIYIYTIHSTCQDILIDLDPIRFQYDSNIYIYICFPTLRLTIYPHDWPD